MAVGAFNTHNLEMCPSIIRVAARLHTPVIIQTSEGTASYVGHRNLVAVCKSMAEEYGVNVVLHLDHAKNFDEIRKALEAGYSLVMFDGSALPFKENILGTKRIVEMAQAHGASVEAELGTVGGTEDGVAVADADVPTPIPSRPSSSSRRPASMPLPSLSAPTMVSTSPRPTSPSISSRRSAMP